MTHTHEQHQHEHHRHVSIAGELTPVAAGAVWTCPMHPEIVSDRPGSCPICGMALEPRVAVADEKPSEEYLSMRRRLAVGAPLAALTLLLAMSDMIPGAPVQHALGARLSLWLQFALSTPVVLWGGWPFFQRGWASVRNRHLNMFTLIAGTGVAYGFSVFALLLPHVAARCIPHASGKPARVVRAAPTR
jgi:Cu+-exporting ATPase